MESEIRSSFYGLLASSDLLEPLQLLDPSAQKRIHWQNGGCFILAQGLYGWVRPYLLSASVEAVWESWNEEPYHVGVTFGEYFFDSTGIQEKTVVCHEWEDYFRGGAFLADISETCAISYELLTSSSLSKKITDACLELFGPWRTELFPVLMK